MIDHVVRVHFQAISGDKRVAAGTKGSVMFVTWLEIDGEHVALNTSSQEVQYSLVGAAPSGFLFLELFRPPDELRARFTDADIVLVEDTDDNGDLLRLHVRSIEFVEESRPQPVPVLPPVEQ